MRERSLVQGQAARSSASQQLTEPGYALCPPVTDKFDDQVAQVVHKHGDVWVRCAAADTARRVDEARAVCAFSSALAGYNKALELQL